MMARMLTCRELIEFLAAYLDEELSADERARFDAHLAVCPHCVDYLHGYRESIRLGKAALAAEGPIPDDVPVDLLDAILAARRRDTTC
ncbi:MAG TPA: zf-HC2 domain-containing protein [Myxococcota bacterium]|nr:zf-HC2 domain-containing protein [Myxococcota bacterium]